MPMCTNSAEPVASMGNDTPLAVLSDRPQLLFNYFRPAVCPSDQPAHRPAPRRAGDESDRVYWGSRQPHPLAGRWDIARWYACPTPILTNTQLDILCNIRYKGFKSVKVLPMLFEVSRGSEGLRDRYRPALQAGGTVGDRRRETTSS